MNVPSETDWVRVTQMNDADIDTSDIPELTEDFFKNARIRWPEKKQQITLRVDQDVIAWFKHQGKGYQSAMNAVLRKYVDVHVKIPGI
jgi:uncharacterized protein (DUF4415 family)